MPIDVSVPKNTGRTSAAWKVGVGSRLAGNGGLIVGSCLSVNVLSVGSPVHLADGGSHTRFARVSQVPTGVLSPYNAASVVAASPVAKAEPIAGPKNP